MKSSAACLVTLLLAATQADAECVPGHRETISPGYVVEHKCDLFREGDVHNNIGSNNECAKLCEAAARAVCSYHPPTKRCVVGKDSGRNIPRTGVTYMEKVEDAAVDDPFAVDCNEEKDACLLRETTLNDELAQCKSNAASSAAASATLQDVLAANCPSKHAKETTVSGKQYKIWCSRYHDPSGAKETQNVDTLAECVNLCSAKTWCTYALHGVYQTKCQLYQRSVAYTTTPGISNNAWHCAVKK
ncbi:hypothetical protein HRG_009403 [Hirsutella rhossiliensis]|uniref:Apple domain-containing protein n=1 Tax=Hirsutella rhossiliensis TaxID=111463 RepID=A0A9P8MSW2_9HYPO|nr:uncharacterized protein HRG_09403 [Hirsutella rhossiliensis]KAH0959621.1 hypothetical protein HRG_09403 [Hirsutella rhossiliensis]